MSNNHRTSSFILPQEIVRSVKHTRRYDTQMVAFTVAKDAIIKGKIYCDVIVNDTESGYGIICNDPVKDGTNGTFNEIFVFNCDAECGILIKKSSNFLVINDDGTVKDKSITDMREDTGKYSVGEYVSVRMNKTVNGRIKHVGKINGILCYAVELNKDPHYYKATVIVIEKDILDNEIKDMTKHNIHTYYKIGAYVQFASYYFGVVKKYILIDRIVYHLVETDTEYLNIKLIDVRYGVPLIFDNNSAFYTVDDPIKYGIITAFKIGSTVTNDVRHGHISWMGFDPDNIFKFGITLEDPDGNDNGTFYGQTLFTTKKGYATLVYSCDVIPDERFPIVEDQRNLQPKKPSQSVTEYTFPIYKIPIGDNYGIQGNLNSSYIDTSIFAIFSFNLFFDNILLDEVTDPGIKDLQDILKTDLVFPLRKYHYVTFDKVRNFRRKLQDLCPNGKFLSDERDPQELLETLFHLLIPKSYLFRTKRFNENFEQKCFIAQLFYQHISSRRELNVLEMLTLTCLHSEILISKPPKVLILQLPRHGRELKRFKTVKILPKIDITPFIVVSAKTCSTCVKEVNDIYMCVECSMKSYKLTFYCEDHRKKCGHDIKCMKYDWQPYIAKVNLELVAILCIESTHYIAYVKTKAFNEKWIYFNSMERLEDGEFIPITRVTRLDEYFQDHEKEGGKRDLELQRDIDKIENYAFVCFYKNPCQEIYFRDFNSD